MIELWNNGMMAENGWNCCGWSGMAGISENGITMARNGWKLLEILKMAGSDEMIKH